MKTRLFLASAIAAAIAAPAVTGAQPAPMPKFEAEKCYGIAKAGKNDCQTANSSCAGTSKRDAPAGRLGVRPEGHLRPARQRQHAAPRLGPSPASGRVA